MSVTARDPHQPMNPWADRRSWLAWRREGLGASDAAAIAGLDPWKGAMSVWLDKTGRLPLDDEEAEYRRWGNLLEPAIADEFERRMGLLVVDRGIWRFHTDYPWMRATLDGLVTEGGEAPALGVLEIKTAAGFKTGDWAEEVPEHFQLQIQHQLAVTGLEHAWLAVLFGGQRFETYELERDQELIDSLIGLEETFWIKHVLADVPPASDGSIGTSESLRRAFLGGGGEVELPASTEQWIAQRAAGKAALKAAESTVLEAEQALMTFLGDAEVGLLGGRPRLSWKSQTRKEHVVRASTFRVLRVVGEEES